MNRDHESYRRARDVSVHWYNRASDLRAAAGAVWVAMLDGAPDARLGLPVGTRMTAACPRVFHMLCGSALELCLKAIVVTKGETPKRTHDLVQLCTHAGVTFGQREAGLLRVLTDATTWMARYPIPTGESAAAHRKYEAASKHVRASLVAEQSLGRTRIQRPNGALDWIGFNQLWELASSAYWSHHQDISESHPRR